MTLELTLQEEKVKDFNMFGFIRMPGTSTSVYYAYLDNTVATGRYESRKDFITQYMQYKDRARRV